MHQNERIAQEFLRRHQDEYPLKAVMSITAFYVNFAAADNETGFKNTDRSREAGIIIYYPRR